MRVLALLLIVACSPSSAPDGGTGGHGGGKRDAGTAGGSTAGGQGGGDAGGDAGGTAGGTGGGQAGGTAGGTAGGNTTPSCPTPQAGSVESTLAWGDVDQLRLAPGQIASYPLVAPMGTTSSVVLTQGQQPSTPAQPVTEFTVSRCRGVIEPDAGYCYYRSVFVNYNNIASYTKPVNGWVDQATLGANGCWAPSSEGQWYVNIRWTYATCPFASCGFSMQWTQGPY